jgi:hypothetical protein
VPGIGTEMKEVPADDRRLTRYLLGESDAQEQEAIELKILDDPAFHEELRAAERDLIDRYVHGELADAAAFERQFLSSPKRRERVEFALALKRSLDQAPVAAAAATSPRPTSRWKRLLSTFDLSIPVWQLAAASFIVFVGAALLLLAWQRQNTPREPSRVVQEQPTPEPIAPPPAPVPNEPSRGSSAPAVAPRFATLVLTPTLTRSASDPTPALTLDGDVQVRLELHLESADYPRYRARVRTADGVDVSNQDRLQADRTSAGPVVVLTMPPGLLAPGDYTVRVSGIAADGEADEVASYYFKVQRQ